VKRRMVEGSDAFRIELLKLMPGYSWTVHKSLFEDRIEATGTQSSGSNRLSTLSVIRTQGSDGVVRYEARSAGYGLRAPWLHTNADGTLARALRGLQDHYEHRAATYRSHAAALQQGRALGVEPSEPLRHSTKENGDCPHWCRACAAEREQRIAGVKELPGGQDG